MRIVLSGLPGTGKTTIGKASAAKRSWTYVRVDEIEHVLTQDVAQGRELGPAGYLVAFAIARSNLELGNFVVADSVNPVPESRRDWRNVAHGTGSSFLEIELVCSNESEHRQRVETRTADIVGFELPSWASVKTRAYAPWTTTRVVVDTALISPSDAVAEIEARIEAMSGNAASSK